jgi:hypothetical protein
MPRFARLFEAAADTLNAFYQALADAHPDALMALWIDEDFASCICADGTHLHGLEEIRAGFTKSLAARPLIIEPLDVRVYDSLGTIVYTIAEAHQHPGDEQPRMVFSTYVMIHERGEWRIAHIHASLIPDHTAHQFAAKIRHGQGSLH